MIAESRSRISHVKQLHGIRIASNAPSRCIQDTSIVSGRTNREFSAENLAIVHSIIYVDNNACNFRQLQSHPRWRHSATDLRQQSANKTTTNNQ